MPNFLCFRTINYGNQKITLTSQQDSLAQAQGDTALNLVDLFRTLGGGWEAGEDPAEYEAPAAPASVEDEPPAAGARDAVAADVTAPAPEQPG